MLTSQELFERIGSFFKGEIAYDSETLRFYSHDASLFEMTPKLVVFPKDHEDVCNLVEFVKANKKNDPSLSLTARSGGTDMSGGAINESIVVSFDRYFTGISPIKDDEVIVQPGVRYRDLEPVTLAAGKLLPSYPASKELCEIGGMVANNSGGEKSLVYGKTDRYIQQIKMVMHDGREHTFEPLSGEALDMKLKEKGIEGDVYRGVYNLVTKNKTIIDKAKPRVAKNSAGYNLWDVWDGRTFDMTKIIAGSQGTLGLLTEIRFSLVPAQPLSGMVVAFLPKLDNLGKIINNLLPLKPTSLESFDEHTLKFAFRFFVSFRKTLGMKRFLILGLSFIPVLSKLLRYFPRLPKIIMLIEFEGAEQSEINTKLKQAEESMKLLGVETHIARDRRHEEKFWTMRRESFNLLRNNVRNKHTAPFIDDLIVPPEALPEFLPRLNDILDKHRFMYTIAGHMGDGNFHIIPLMDLTRQEERDTIYPALEEVTDLVLEYGGSLTGEHNDGLIRGPLLERMYGEEVTGMMDEVKRLFDPENIFNPHKKTDAELEFSKSRMRSKF